MEDFEFFVCYSEDTGKDFAEVIYKILSNRRGYSVYVNHVYRIAESGKFEEHIDGIIKRCKVFVLLNTYGVLERTQVIREVNVAFPNGKKNHEFWIFRDITLTDTAFTNNEFEKRTGLKLKEFTQHPFRTDSELNRLLLINCDNRKKIDFIQTNSFTFI